MCHKNGINDHYSEFTKCHDDGAELRFCNFELGRGGKLARRVSRLSSFSGKLAVQWSRALAQPISLSQLTTTLS